MSLQTLTTPEQAVAFLRARVTGTLQTDSRLVAPGDAFIAWPGAATDGRAHVAGALALGMLDVMFIVMLGYSALQRRAARWQR